MNQRLFLVVGVLSVGLILGFLLTVSAQENLIPSWIKNTAGWWSEDAVSDSDFISSMQWLMDNKILQVLNTEDSEWKIEADKLYKENQQLKAEINVLQNDLIELLKENTESLTGNTELTEYDDAGFASLSASYDKYDDETNVTLYFTNNDGNYVKASGKVKITLCAVPYGTDKLIDCFSNDFKFEKSGFYTWQDSYGRQITGHSFVIYQELVGDEVTFRWDASADITLENGYSWVDVDTSFQAFDE